MPTAAGQTAGRHARLLADRLALASEEVDAVARGVSGSLRIASFPGGSAALLPGPLRGLANERPDLAIIVGERLPDDALAGIRDGAIDLALVADLESTAPLDTHGLTATELVRAQVSVMLAAGHRLAERPVIPLGELLSDRWIQSSDAVCAAIVAQAALQHDATPQVTTHTTDIAATRGLVAGGLGIALISDLLGAEDHPGVVVRGVDPPISHPVLVVTPLAPHTLPAADALRQRLLDSSHSNPGELASR